MATRTGWRSPALLGLLGLALMVGGWKLASWTREPAGLARLRELARQQEREEGPGATGGLAERLEEMARPYRVAGRVLIFVGLALFVAAGLLMYRRPEPEEQKEEEGAGEEGRPGP
jgi:hypothetical protein